MEKPILYYTELSPPSRSVRYVAEQLGLAVEIRNVNLVEQEQNKEEFKKINPVQTIPALDDNGFKLFESHAIMMYLVDKYAHNDTLYPKSLNERATINAMLHFETQFLFGRCRNAIELVFYYNGKAFASDDINRLKNSLDRFESLVAASETRYLAGDHPTIIDFSCITSITSLDFFIPITMHNYPKIYQWRSNLFLRVPGLEQSESNAIDNLKNILVMKMQANQQIYKDSVCAYSD